MTRDAVRNRYFEWLFSLVDNRADGYQKLLTHLHNTEFWYSIPNDKNRAADGIDLRYRFGVEHGIDYAESYLEGPCSVLEMMVALCMRCEIHIMSDPDIGDRTGKWFWEMIANLGLSSQTDIRYDKQFVSEVISTFLNRRYSKNGEGGLFAVRKSRIDMRDVEIWYQMCWYLDEVLGGDIMR